MLLVAVLLAVGAPQRAAAQRGTRPVEVALVGTWELDPGRTHYGAGVDRRRRERLRCALRVRLLDCAIESERDDGRRVTAHFAAPLGGGSAAVTGITDVDAVRLQALDGGIVDATFSYRGRPAFGYRAYRSEDGATLVIVSVDPLSRAALTSVVVYNRAAPGAGPTPPGRR